MGDGAILVLTSDIEGFFCFFMGNLPDGDLIRPAALALKGTIKQERDYTQITKCAHQQRLPCTLYLVPCTLYLVPCTLYLVPYSSLTDLRKFFTNPRLVLLSRRLFTEDRFGLVGIRFFGTTMACLIIVLSRSSASSLLRS